MKFIIEMKDVKTGEKQYIGVVRLSQKTYQNTIFPTFADALQHPFEAKGALASAAGKIIEHLPTGKNIIYRAFEVL